MSFPKWKKYGVNEKRQKDLLEQREGEDAYQMIARQLAMARPFEVAWLMMIRAGDEKQLRAMEMLQLSRTVFWTRLAVILAAASFPLSVVALIVQRG